MFMTPEQIQEIEDRANAAQNLDRSSKEYLEWAEQADRDIEQLIDFIRNPIPMPPSQP